MEQQLESYLLATFRENVAILTLYPSAFARALVTFSPAFARQVASAVNALVK